MSIHKADLRLRNNAGINYPVCLAVKDKPLDFDHGKVVTNNNAEVTCRACKKAWSKAYPWATPIPR